MSFSGTLREKVVKTRTPHQCSDCLKAIEVGSKAVYSVWIWEGDLNRAYFHESCFKRVMDQCDEHGEWHEGDGEGLEKEKLSPEGASKRQEVESGEGIESWNE